MSLKGSNKLDTNKYELEITVDGESFREAIRTVYAKEANNITVKGFRKGKAPLHMVEKMYGEGVFFEDAINLLYEDILLGAVKEAGLKLVDVEKTDITSISKADGAELKITVIVEPEVTLGDYKGLAVERVIPTVSDDEVKAELDKTNNVAAAAYLGTVIAKKALEKGIDTVVFDRGGFLYQGKIAALADAAREAGLKF